MCIPITHIDDVLNVGGDCLRVRTRLVKCIPINIIGNKTRLLKPVMEQEISAEFSIIIHNSYLSEVSSLVNSLHNKTHSFVKPMELIFDLTALSSHRESLLLPRALRVIRVKKMLEIPGIVQVTKQNIYFQPRAALGPKRVKEFGLSSQGSSTITSTRRQRYKLKDTCVEVQFTSGKNLLLQFDTKGDCESFLRAISPGESILTDRLPPLHAVTELWRNCEISNFDYLMYLNHLAGRSVNDIGQYPILPWTISNMTSVSLDLTDESNYRDLAQPIAATNKTKLEQSRQRALQMSPKERFLFGSFYSNPAFVLYFLLRRYPECHLRLHGGHFDHTARLFTSLKGAWEAVAESGSATMELIPEFYSEFESANTWLRNLPTMTQVTEVRLPDWASSPTDFVIKMRCALESPVVSCKLNKWIDLVFGVKSRGREICFQNNNLFHPICYLTDVESDVVDYCNDHQAARNVVLLQSQEFGHVPQQLFVTDQHPARDLSKLKSEWWSESFYQSGGGRDSWRSVLQNSNIS